jgi:chorismate synthase
MSGANSFGSRLVLTTFGESHGSALGGVLDGVPAGIRWDQELLERELARRRPGQSKVVSARAEGDAPRWVLMNGSEKTIVAIVTFI